MLQRLELLDNYGEERNGKNFGECIYRNVSNCTEDDGTSTFCGYFFVLKWMDLSRAYGIGEHWKLTVRDYATAVAARTQIDMRYRFLMNILE